MRQRQTPKGFDAEVMIGQAFGSRPEIGEAKKAEERRQAAYQPPGHARSLESKGRPDKGQGWCQRERAGGHRS